MTQKVVLVFHRMLSKYYSSNFMSVILSITQIAATNNTLLIRTLIIENTDNTIIAKQSTDLDGHIKQPWEML